MKELSRFNFSKILSTLNGRGSWVFGPIFGAPLYYYYYYYYNYVVISEHINLLTMSCILLSICV